jgi:hypothetical protein
VLLTLLETLAEQQPVILVAEDVHWADRSTSDLLSFLVRNIQQARVLLVVTFRSDELNRNDLLRPLLSGLARTDGVSRLELARLSRAQAAVQLEGILGRPLRRRAGLRQELLLPGQLDDLRAALRLAGAPSLVRAQVLARLCWALKREDRYAESEQMAVDLRALAEQLGDEEHRVEADMALASLGALRGEDTMAALRGTQEAAQRAGFGLLEAWAYLTITNALEGGGRHELAIPAGREGLAQGQAARSGPLAWRGRRDGLPSASAGRQVTAVP